jgi:FkbM family methyltransferase
MCQFLIISTFIFFCFSIDASTPKRYPRFSRAHILGEARKILKNNPLIIDAGCYTGSDSILMAKFWPKATIYCFEPVPELFETTLITTANYPNIFPFQIALSNKTGLAPFYLSEKDESYSQSSSLLPPTGHLSLHPNIKYKRNCLVQTLTIDDWAREQRIAKVDFLWLFLQGHELATICDSQICKNATVICLEVSFKEAFKGQALYSEVKKWMQTNGFKLIACDFNEESALQGAVADSEYFSTALFVKMNRD